MLGLVAGGCGDDGGPEFPDADSYDFDGSFRDGAAAGASGGRRDGGAPSAAGSGSAGSGAAGGTGTAGGGTAGAGGPVSGGTGGGPGPGAIFCDASGNCLYPSGLLCFANGSCCYTSDVKDGYCCSGAGCQMVPPWVGVPDPIDPPDGGTQPWSPPIDEDQIGDPGWRDSDDPLCFGGNNPSYTQSLWSDSRGVYVVSVTEQVWDPMNPSNCVGCLRERIDFNDGTGWKELEGVWDDDQARFQSGGQMFITGFNNGPLVLYGYSSMPNGMPCGLSFYEDGKRSCEPVDGVSDVAVVSDTLAYALLQGDLVRYDGERWGPISTPLPTQREMQYMWADESVVMITGTSPGAIYTLKDGAFRVENTRTLETFSTIWGFSPTDVWAGTYQGGLFHYDGTDWKRVDWPAPDCGEPMIFAMWGANGKLYFNTQTAVMRWNGTSVEKLTELDCGGAQLGELGFTSLWGNDENEVFIGMVDVRQRFNDCGPMFLLYYDGSKFHHM